MIQSGDGDQGPSMPLTFGPLGNKKNPKRVRHTKPKKTNPLDLISFNQISDPHHLEGTLQIQRDAKK